MAYTVGMEETGRTYTIKEAADMLGMTKAGLRYRIQTMGLTDKIIRDTGPQGRLIIPDTVLHLLDKTNRIETESERKDIPFSFQSNPDSDRIDTGKTERLSGKQKETESGKKQDNLPVEYAALIAHVSDLSHTVTVMQETITKQQDMMNRIFQSLDARMEELKDKDRQIEELKEQLHRTQEQPQTNAVPTDPEGTQGPVPWWKRWFT